MHKRLLVFVAALLITAVPVAAQAQGKRGMFIIGGGYTAPNSEVRDHLGDGYNFLIGGQGNVTPNFGIEGSTASTVSVTSRSAFPCSTLPTTRSARRPTSSPA
jgi:hypothetical protein